MLDKGEIVVYLLFDQYIRKNLPYAYINVGMKS